MRNHTALEWREQAKPSTEREVTDGCQGWKCCGETFGFSSNDRPCPRTVQLLAGSTKWLLLPKREGWSGRGQCQERSLSTDKVGRSCRELAWHNPALRQTGSLAVSSPSGMPEKDLPGNQEASVHVPILLLANPVTLEPGKPTPYVPVYLSTISLGHGHDKNIYKSKPTNCFDHRQYSKSNTQLQSHDWKAMEVCLWRGHEPLVPV